MVGARRRVASAVLIAIAIGGCTFPGTRERDFVLAKLKGLPDVDRAQVSCNDRWWSAGSEVCATVTMKDGVSMTFQGLGFQSFGPSPSRVRIVEAGGRAVKVASCQSGVRVEAFADIDRGGFVGHHFSPPISGVADALRVHQDVTEELEFWPECPQFWEVQDQQGVNRRYCAHAARNTAATAPALPECR